MEGSSEVFRSRVYEGSIFNENFYKLYMTLTSGNMERCPSISICAVDADLRLINWLGFQYLKTAELVSDLDSEP